MKIYIAEDWTGIKIFGNPPQLMKCGGMPKIWSGWRLPFNIKKDLITIPSGEYIEKELKWLIEV